MSFCFDANFFLPVALAGMIAIGYGYVVAWSGFPDAAAGVGAVVFLWRAFMRDKERRREQAGRHAD